MKNYIVFSKNKFFFTCDTIEYSILKEKLEKIFAIEISTEAKDHLTNEYRVTLTFKDEYNIVYRWFLFETFKDAQKFVKYIKKYTDFKNIKYNINYYNKNITNSDSDS